MFDKIIRWFQWWYHFRRRMIAVATLVQGHGDQFDNLWKQVNNLKESSVTHDQLKALQAIDFDWHDCGKIILMFHFDGKDIVKIIDVKRKTTIKEYQQLSGQLEREYGAAPKYFDGIDGYDEFWQRSITDKW